jgi:hypothetical protein
MRLTPVVLLRGEEKVSSEFVQTSVSEARQQATGFLNNTIGVTYEGLSIGPVRVSVRFI